MGAEKRKGILDEASEYVTVDRNESYGEPEDNFGNIAAIWNAQGVRINGRDVNGSDVALMMIGMKLARLRFNPSHRDSWVDTVGYAACGGDIALKDDPTLVTSGPFVGWHNVGSTDDRTMSTAVAEAARLKYAGGWQSDNQCGERLNPIDVDRFGAEPHVAHTYGSGGVHWCDGYVAPLVPVHAGENDLDVVKRVAGKLMWKEEVDPYQGIKTRPIKDCPQA